MARRTISSADFSARVPIKQADRWSKKIFFARLLLEECPEGSDTIEGCGEVSFSESAAAEELGCGEESSSESTAIEELESLFAMGHRLLVGFLSRIRRV